MTKCTDCQHLRTKSANIYGNIITDYLCLNADREKYQTPATYINHPDKFGCCYFTKAEPSTSCGTALILLTPKNLGTNKTEREINNVINSIPEITERTSERSNHRSTRQREHQKRYLKSELMSWLNCSKINNQRITII